MKHAQSVCNTGCSLFQVHLYLGKADAFIESLIKLLSLVRVGIILRKVCILFMSLKYLALQYHSMYYHSNDCQNYKP